METTALKELGFKDTEIKVYLALLALKSSSVTKISEKAEIDRTQTYDVLEKLINKGLASFILRNNVKYYQPNDPSIILNELKKKQESFLKLLPFLESMYKEPKEDTKVEVFKGKDGLKAIFNDILKQGKEQRMIGGFKEFETIAPYITKHFLDAMEKNKIPEKVLYTKGEKILKIKTGKYRILPKEYLSPVNTTFYSDKIVFVIFKSPLFLIRIVNKELANSYRKYFDLLWKTATP